MLNLLDDLLLGDMYDNIVLRDDWDWDTSWLDDLVSLLGVADGDLDISWLEYLASLLENPDDDATGVFSIIGTQFTIDRIYMIMYNRFVKFYKIIRRKS